MPDRRRRARPLEESIREYGRGVAGGLLFSLPLLYTAEVWEAGFRLDPIRQLAALGLTFAVLLGYNRFAGLRPERSWSEVLIEAVEELGLGLLLAALILALLDRITADQQPIEVVGRVVMEGIGVAIGVSVGTAQLGARSLEDAGDSEQREIGFSGQVTVAFCGAVLLAANIAPTDEILELAAESPPWKLGAIAGLSVVLAAFVLFFGDFRGSHRWVRADDMTAVARGTVITYAVALAASATLLWVFGRFDGESSRVVIAQTVTLGLASALGASAGRLLLLQ